MDREITLFSPGYHQLIFTPHELNKHREESENKSILTRGHPPCEAAHLGQQDGGDQAQQLCVMDPMAGEAQPIAGCHLSQEGSAQQLDLLGALG